MQDAKMQDAKEQVFRYNSSQFFGPRLGLDSGINWQEFREKFIFWNLGGGGKKLGPSWCHSLSKYKDDKHN